MSVYKSFEVAYTSIKALKRIFYGNSLQIFIIILYCQYSLQILQQVVK